MNVHYIQCMQYTLCPEKNATNNVLGITLTNTNVYSIVVILAQNVVKVMRNQTNTIKVRHT